MLSLLDILLLRMDSYAFVFHSKKNNKDSFSHCILYCDLTHKALCNFDSYFLWLIVEKYLCLFQEFAQRTFQVNKLCCYDCLLVFCPCCIEVGANKAVEKFCELSLFFYFFREVGRHLSCVFVLFELEIEATQKKAHYQSERHFNHVLSPLLLLLRR